jgi:hypothetical protein
LAVRPDLGVENRGGIEPEKDRSRGGFLARAEAGERGEIPNLRACLFQPARDQGEQGNRAEEFHDERERGKTAGKFGLPMRDGAVMNVEPVDPCGGHQQAQREVIQNVLL